MKIVLRSMTLAALAAVMVATSGCNSFGRRKGKSPAATDWELHPEALAHELPMVGLRFDETRERFQDVQFDNVRFEFDSFQVPASEVPKVESVGRYLSANPSVVMIVEGHCDERGSREYNLSLGEQRAQSVRAYLIGLGIAPDRLQTVSFGKERPLDPGHNEAAWRLNRRVEFITYR